MESELFNGGFGYVYLDEEPTTTSYLSCPGLFELLFQLLIHTSPISPFNGNNPGPRRSSAMHLCYFEDVTSDQENLCAELHVLRVKFTRKIAPSRNGSEGGFNKKIEISSEF